MSIRVLLVDDSEFFTEELSQLFRGEGEFEVVGTAGDGLAALHVAEDLEPDLITLDVRMPVMDGVTTLKQIMTCRPVPTVMVSALTTGDSHLTFECLRYGAVDFVAKPSGDGPGTLVEQKDDIVAIARRAAEVDRRFLKYHRLRPVPPGTKALPEQTPRRMLAVAAGRGGLMSVLGLLNRLTPPGDAAVVVSVDLPPSVVESFSLYLSRFSPWEISSATPDTPLLWGRAFLVPTSSPLILVQEDGKTYLRPFKAPPGTEREHLMAALLRSVAEDFGERGLAVLLPGASRGALAGLNSVREAGGSTFAQSPSSSPVSGILSEAQTRDVVDHLADIATLSARLSNELLLEQA